MDGNGCSIGTHILSYKPENTPTKAKTAPTTPAITTIGLGWTSQPHLIDLPIIRSNTFPKK